MTNVIVGCDISTAVLGICFLDADTGSVLEKTHINLSKIHGLIPKADQVQVFLSTLNKPEYTFKRIFVEENAKMFTPGFSSADTILTLAKFNGIVSYIAAKEFKVEIFDVNVRSARARLGIKIDYKDKTQTTKEKVFKKVRDLYPSMTWPMHIAKAGKSKGLVVFDKEATDEADAFICCAGGRLLFGNKT